MKRQKVAALEQNATKGKKSRSKLRGAAKLRSVASKVKDVRMLMGMTSSKAKKKTKKKDKMRKQLSLFAR